MSRLLSFFGGNPLDDTFYSGWSLRKIRAAYSGNCIQVRRSSDNALQDIGFTSSGVLDTASLLSFVGVGSGFVRTFYNQSATSGLDFVQTVNNNQPRIVLNGTIATLNGKPSLTFNTGLQFMQIPSSTSLFNFLHNGGLGCISSVFNANTSAGRYICGNLGNNIARVGIISFTSSANFVGLLVCRGVFNSEVVRNQSSNNTISNNTSQLLITYVDADNTPASQRSTLYINRGSAINNNTQTNAPSSANAFANFCLGEDGVGANRFQGYISELLVYNSHPDINQVRPNQLNFYGL